MALHTLAEKFTVEREGAWPGEFHDQYGELVWDDAQQMLLLTSLEDGDQEVLTVDLMSYGYVPPPGHAYIKDWSIQIGVAAALESAGLVEVIEKITFGPWKTRAQLVRIIR